MKQDILNSNLHSVETVGEFTSYKAEIDQEDLGWILNILSTNLYSDPIGSLIREYSSNAWDANIEAGKRDQPIEVGLKTDADVGSYWYVTDLGLGISPERIETVYRKFGKSTKRTCNEAIGMMGLGKFSGLSYADQVYIITRFEGIEYQYIMHKAEGRPELNLLSSVPSKAPSGTTIRIMIKDYRDRIHFADKTKQQLAYFENIYFNCDNDDLTNDYTIIKGKHFTQSSLDTRPLRIKIGPVSYPIDNEVLGLEAQMIDRLYGIAINFNIGEVAITPNRESILYNKQTIANIQAKLEPFMQEIADLYDGSSAEFEDPIQFIKALKDFQIVIGNTPYNLPTCIKKLCKKIPVLKEYPYPINPDNASQLFSGYKTAGDIRKGKVVHEGLSYLPFDFVDKLKTITSYNPPYLFIEAGGLDRKTIQFICETKGSDYWRLLKFTGAYLFPRDDKHVSYSYGHANSKCLYNLLRLDEVPRKDWRDRITKFQKWQSNYLFKSQKVLKYSDCQPTAEWLLSKKLPKSDVSIAALRKSEGKFLTKRLEIKSGYKAETRLVPAEKYIKNLPDTRKVVIYGVEDELEMLRSLAMFSEVKGKSSFEVWLVAKVHHKYFKELPNFMSYTKFMEGNNKLFRHYATCNVLNKLYQSNLYLEQSLEMIGHLNAEHAITIADVVQTVRKFGDDINWTNTSVKVLLDTMTAVAQTNNLWDFKVKALIHDFEKIIPLYHFIKELRVGKSGYGTSPHAYGEDTKALAVEIAKFRKIKLNLRHYVNPIKEEEPGNELPAEDSTQGEEETIDENFETEMHDTSSEF
jgi:hypothetical protein